MLRCVKFKRTVLSNVLTAKAISGALLSSYLTQCIKNTNSVATTPLQFRLGMYNFVTEFCVMYSLIIHFGITNTMYHLSVLPPKQNEIPLIDSRQISIPNVSPNLTDAHISKKIFK